MLALPGIHDLPSIPVNRPLLPTAERLLPYLRRIDANRYYTNFGPLHDELLDRLAGHFNLNTGHLVLASSGTAGLMALILAIAGRATAKKPLCVCPAYTFVATAVAASACGYTPYLADVKAEDWCLDPGRVENLPRLEQAALVTVAAPYGRMPDLAAWGAFTRRTGIPVIVDAAACFDSIDAAALHSEGLAAVVSLHATKTFSTAEGGLLICPDAAMAERAGRALNFGFHNSRESVGPSINGKISEYHAAIGLAELDHWPEKRQGFIAAARHYLAAADRHGLASRIIADGRHANPYALFVAASEGEARSVTMALDAAGAGHRLWYGLGLHHQPEYRAVPSDCLGETAEIAPRIIGLPMQPDINSKVIGQVISVIASAAA